MSAIFNHILGDLRAKYPSALLTPTQAGIELGYAPQTSRNRVCRGVFPLPLIMRGTKCVVSVYALAEFLAGGDPFFATSAAPEVLPLPPVKRGPGRPRKTPMEVEGGAK